MAQVLLVPGSLQRICQLTGEHDRTKGGHVPSRTFSRCGTRGYRSWFQGRAAWKLGRVVTGRASPRSFTTYEEERRAADDVAVSLSHAAQTDMLVPGSVHARALAVHLARARTQMLETEAGVELQIHYPPDRS